MCGSHFVVSNDFYDKVGQGVNHPLKYMAQQVVYDQISSVFRLLNSSFFQDDFNLRNA